jgi:hypothetical protein
MCLREGGWLAAILHNVAPCICARTWVENGCQALPPLAADLPCTCICCQKAHHGCVFDFSLPMPL